MTVVLIVLAVFAVSAAAALFVAHVRRVSHHPNSRSGQPPTTPSAAGTAHPGGEIRGRCRNYAASYPPQGVPRPNPHEDEVQP